MDNKFLFMGDATSNGTSIEIEELDINLNGNN